MKILDKIKEYTKEKRQKISKIYNFDKKYNMKINNDIISIYDNNNKIFASKFIFFGIYQSNTKLWIWASSIPDIRKDIIKEINKIKFNFIHLFENDNNKKINFYYQLLSQDILFIEDLKLLSWINDLLVYLSNGIICLNPINSEENIQFLVLTKIKEKYL